MWLFLFKSEGCVFLQVSLKKRALLFLVYMSGPDFWKLVYDACLGRKEAPMPLLGGMYVLYTYMDWTLWGRQIV